MGKAEHGKQPQGDTPALDEDLDIRATLQQLLVNTEGIPDMNTEINELKTQIKKTNDVLIPAKSPPFKKALKNSVETWKCKTHT